MRLTVSIDGASRGNPGAAGIGVVVCDENGAVLKEISEYIGETTNNVAEYTALIRGLEEALAMGAESVHLRTDSELLAYQLSGTYKVKAPHLRRLNESARALVNKFRTVSLARVSRDQNAQADALATKAAQSAKAPSEETTIMLKEDDGQQGTLI